MDGKLSFPNCLGKYRFMAGNSAKKIAEKNKEVLSFYIRIHYASLLIYLVKLGLDLQVGGVELSVNRVGNALLWIINHFIVTNFQSTSAHGGDLSATGGLLSFLVDCFLISWFVINTTTLLSNYFMYTLIFVPIFGFLKLKQVWNGLFGKEELIVKKK